MKPRVIAVIVLLVAAAVLVVEAAQRPWIVPLKPGASTASRSSFLRAVHPDASIGSNANGIYCASPATNGVGIHDLGAIPIGLHVTVTVHSYSDGFNPVAAVLVPTLGQKASNNVRVTNFYDDDSGGGGDPKVDFVTPQEGNYILVVGDYTDSVAGCYRYQLQIG
jgi:hypothetical protein